MPGTVLSSGIEEQNQGRPGRRVHVASVVSSGRQTITGQSQDSVINLSTSGTFSSLWFPVFLFCFVFHFLFSFFFTPCEQNAEV